ncbi:hypothetical protein GH714_001358 [Hevea brasiliensis]|uniref:SET domain-containing protein n=1 Tax=Hevea brasiliensis TaxID=3981 RepID=A0A6A6KHM8_HEVBR|nr:hypothetical protein GH714_001358 [Hevea brasiliensis]
MTNERVYNAFKATRALGLPDEEVKPVLKDLLKVIEGEKKSLAKDDVPKRASKRLCFEEQEDQSSSTLGGTSVTGLELGTRESSQLCSESRKDRGIESSSLFPNRQLNQKKKDPIPSERLLEVEIQLLGCREHIKQRTERIINDSADFAEPTSAIDPVFCLVCQAASTRDKVVGYLASQCDGSGSGSNDSTHCASNFVIASSTLEEVKILLNCDSAVGRANFKIPDFNAVLKFLDEKYLRIDKLVSPQFSIMTLLKDFCESYLESGTVSCNMSGNRSIANNSSSVRKVGNSLNSIGSNRRALITGNHNMVLKEKITKPLRFSDSHNLVNKQLQRTTYDEKGSFKRISDITKGAENVKISLIDDIGNVDLPKFTYMPHNIIYQNAYMQISLARIADVDCCSSCSGDCLSSPLPCACASETGGEFAYTQKGLLKQKFLRGCVSMKLDPQKHHYVFCQDCPLERSKNEDMPEQCKGHLVRKFIKECWRKCGCDMNCGNRVVQRGITCRLQVFLTREGKGWGLRTLENLPEGAFVCEYVGEILTNMELYERNENSGNERHTYPVTLDADWGSERILRDEEALCLDATFSGNVARFINHRCGEANLIDIPVEVETPDRHYYHVRIIVALVAHTHIALMLHGNENFQELSCDPNAACIFYNKRSERIGRTDLVKSANLSNKQRARLERYLPARVLIISKLDRTVHEQSAKGTLADDPSALV